MLSAGISEFAKEKEFSYTSGAKAYFSLVGAVYGEYKGCRMVLVHDSREFHQTCRIYVPAAKTEGLDYKLTRLIKKIIELPHVHGATVEDHCLCVEMHKKASPVQKADIETVADTISDFFTKNKILSGCCVCGASGANFIGLDDIPYFTCKACEDKLNDFALKTVEQKKKEPVRAASGAAGAFLLSLSGLLLWTVIVVTFGKLAAVAGYVIAFAAMKGFLLFKGRLTKGTSLLILGISLFTLLLSEYLSILILAAETLAKNGTHITTGGLFAHSLLALFSIIGLKDVLLGAVFVFVAWVIYLLGMFRKKKNSIGYTSDK